MYSPFVSCFYVNSNIPMGVGEPELCNLAQPFGSVSKFLMSKFSSSFVAMINGFLCGQSFDSTFNNLGFKTEKAVSSF